MDLSSRRTDTRSIRLNRRAFTFLLCLLISAFSWFMISLTEVARQVYRVKVTYRNLPEGVHSHSLPDSLKVELSGSGFNLMFYEPPEQGILLDCSGAVPGNGPGEYYLLTARKEKELGLQLGGEVNLSGLEPDTLYMLSIGNASRLVPVVFGGNIILPDGYLLKDSFRLKPDKVTLTGMDSVIGRITSVHTESRSIRVGNEPFQVSVSLLPPGAGMAFSEDSVKLTGTPEKMSISEFMLPVAIINLPEGYAFKSVPREVKVRVMIPFSTLRTFNAEDLEAYVDYKDIRDLGSSQARVNLRSKSRMRWQTKVTPSTVEFILREKSK